MQLTDVPAKFGIPFANAATDAFVRSIPTASQVGIQNGAASLTDGFPPATFTPVSAGGTPPFGQDMNGILRQATAWVRWLSAGAPLYYDPDFAAICGGYPKGSIIRSRIVTGNMWMSTVENNTSDPDAFGAGWVSPPGMWGTGDVRQNIFPNDIPAGWISLRAYTLGSAASGAVYASAETVFLYVKTWNKFSNAQCPVLPGGRGANALADFNANKTIQTLDTSGTAFIGNDNGTNRLNQVPIISGAITVPGSLIGENLHVLTQGELAAHAHTGTTGVESSVHTHFASTTSGGMNNNNPHTHTGPFMTFGPVNNASAAYNAWTTSGGAGALTFPSAALADINHGHEVALNTAGQSVNHTHDITTAIAGSNFAHNNVERSMIVDLLQKL